MGVGKDGFFITDDTATWDEFLDSDTDYTPVMSYVAHKVRLMFDPPQNSAVTQAIEKTIQELEWRINWAYERKQTE